MRRWSSRLVITALASLAPLCLVTALAGCADDSGSGGQNKQTVAMMKKLPAGADAFSFVNCQALRSDDDLRSLCEFFTPTLDQMGSWLGTSVDDVDSFGLSGETWILEGSFALDEVRGALEASGFEKDEYEDTETWDGGFTAVALISNCCIILASPIDIKQCIDVIKGENESLYDSPEVADDIARLPDGLVVGWSPGADGYFGEENYADMKASAMSITKKEADELLMAVIARFLDADTASAQTDHVRQDMSEYLSNVKVGRHGHYVEVIGDIPTDRFTYSQSETTPPS